VKAKVGHFHKSDCWHNSRVMTFGEEVLSLIAFAHGGGNPKTLTGSLA